MCLRSKRISLLLLAYLLCFAAGAQTLYWIGGDGNIKDPQHWSLSPAGSPANITPGINSDLVFSNNGQPALNVTFNSRVEVNSVAIHSLDKITFVQGLSPGKLVIKHSFDNTYFSKNFDSQIPFEFNNPNTFGYINTGNVPLNNDITISGGKWRINMLSLNLSKTLYISHADVDFAHSAVDVGHIDLDKCGPLNFDHNILKVRNDASVKDCNQYSFNKASVNRKMYSDSTLNGQSLSAILSRSFPGSQVYSSCVSTTLQSVSCSPGCDGKVIITLPPASCYTPAATLPYDILISNSGCPGNPASLLGVGPGTYTLTGFCVCTYGLYVNDGNSDQLESIGLPFPPPVILTGTSGTSTITCGGSCTGSLNVNFTGTSPYQHTVTLASGAQYTTTSTGVLTLTNLCAGTFTIFTIDQSLCSNTFTRTFTAPAVLNINPIVNNVACNSACTGSISIAPTGGSPNYSVNFSNGSNYALGTGGTATLTGLCTGPITATLTDSKGCTTTTSANITQPPALTVTTSQASITCNGACTGAASFSVAGGVGPYQYTITPPTGPVSTYTNSGVLNISSLCAGTYTANVKDNNNCTSIQTFSIAQPPPLGIVSTVTNVTCNGGPPCNGAITITVSGGSGAGYTYTWAPFPPSGPGTPSLNNICAGTYTVSVKDGTTACTTTAAIVVTQPPAFTLTAVSQNITCFGVCNGGATLSIGGGNGGYTYTWSPTPPIGQGTPIISNLCGGTAYTVTVRDASLCPVSTTVAIPGVPSLTPNISTGSITCNGLCNGSITAAPSGTATYNYTLATAGTTVTTAPPYTGLCAGTYTLFIRNVATNCVQSFTQAINQPNPLIESISTTSITCFNQCNGSLSGGVLGGTPGYTLTWTTPSGPVVGPVLNGQCAGNYALQVVDANGCITNTATAVLTQPTDITLSITSSSVTCFGSCNGALTAGVTGGTPGYTLNWSNGFTGNPDISLCVGTYSLNVIDANGCTKGMFASVVGPPPITLTQATTAVSCAGGNNGSATITAGGGNGSYTYQFNTIPVTINNTGIISGLTQGVYVANVSDINGCSQSITFTISSPPALSAAITGTQNSCNVCTGAATVQPAGGTPPYISYVWTNSVNATVGTTSVATSLCPGDYTVTVMDTHSCVVTQTVHIALVVNINVLAAGSGIQCFGDCTGTVVANPVGGTLPYASFVWTNSLNAVVSSASTASNLCVGAYSVSVTDALGCSAGTLITLTQPPALTAASSKTDATCFGNCNGTITTTVTGGTGAISYSWSPSAPNSPSLTNVCAGTYTLNIRDQNLCPLSLPVFTVTQNAPLAGAFTSTNPSACIANNGAICVTASGGTGSGYTYTWTPVSGNSSCITGLSAGNYSVIVGDGAGCTTTLNSLLNNPAGPSLSVSTQSIICFNGSTGSATATATGIGPFTFTWTPAVSSSSTSISTIASGLTTGTYVIAATDANTCVTTQSLFVAQAPSVTVNQTISDVKCNAACNGSITLSPSGGTPGYNYSWLPAGLTGSLTGTVTALCQGDFTVNVTDANSCASSYTFHLSEPTALTLTNTATNVKCNAACNGSIVAGASGGTGAITYSWLPVGAFTGSITSTVLNLCPNIYTVVAKDFNNCTITNTIQITEPAALTSTLVLKDATCSNSCNAVATQVVAGGISTYSYSWSSGAATTSVISNLCAGNYTGTVIDANGCTVSKGFTVTPPPPFSMALAVTDPKCNATCNGSISTTPGGAQGGITYNWLPSGSGANPTGLCPGSYTLVAIDDSLCQVTSVVSLNNPPALLANVSTTNAACNGNCNGIAVSSAVNASGAINYSWTPAAANSPTITALCPGDYTLQIQDAAGCQDVVTFTLVDPPLLQVNPSTVPSTCGSSNGAITANVSGGTPGYTYSWSPTVSSNSVISGLAAGIYTVVVSDINNCTNTVTIPLSNSNGPSSASIISSSIACNGLCTGAASLDVSSIVGGTPSYTVSWLAPAPSSVNPLTNLCAGGYTAQITDANNCVLFTGVNIAEPPPVIFSPSFGLPSCNGTCNGSISLNPTGGMGPTFTYTWLPSGPSGPVYTSACAGTYTIIVGDNGCAYPQTITLPSQLNIAVSTSVIPNQCFGDCNAQATAYNTMGGTPPYTYNWSNGQTGTVATNLCDGVYTLIITDASGCFSTFTVPVNSASQLTYTTAITSPSCGLCNGASTITASGGTAPYTYSWTTGASGPSVASLCAGIYNVQITDGLGCKQTETVVINNSSGITSETFSIQPLPCAGTCNGAATVTAIGGTAPISYNWLAPASGGQVASNLCAGTYFVQMTDAQGCMRTSSIAINPVTTMTVAGFVTPPGCGLSNGAINVSIAGGTPAYAVSWNPPIGTTATVTGVSAGSYVITITESSPSACTTTQQINVSSASGPSVAATQSNIKCFGTCTGSISAIASGAAGPFTYKWSNGATTTTVNNLCQGVITLTVTDTNSCTTVQSYTITDNPQLNAGAPMVTQPTCNQCNGAAALNPFGGTPPYTYTWTNGASTPSLSGLCAGIYNVQVTDGLGCQQTETVVINNSNGITSETFSIQPLPCAGTCNGAATVTAVGGTAPISYNWLSPATSGSVITNLCSGTYFVQMTDAQGCLRTSSVTIEPVTNLSVTPNIVAPGCQQSNGSVSLLISGGTPSYSILWMPGGNTTATLSGIAQGSYTVTVTESGPNNCSLSQQINVSNSTGPVVTAAITDVACFGTCTGSITATASGTATPFTYKWSNGSTSATVNNLCKGAITLTVTDANGCVTIKSYSINENPQLQLNTPQVTQPTCNQCNGAAAISALGGILPYTYTWTSGATTPSLSGLCAGMYQVQITDNVGCQQTSSVIINNSSGITSETFSILPLPCAGTCNGAATVTAVGGTAPISYNWLSPATSGSVITSLCAGTYYVQMTDAQGCLRTSSIAINPVTSLTITPSIVEPGCQQNNGSVSILISGGTPTYGIVWAPGGNTTATLSSIGQGSYSVTVTESGPNNCSLTQQINVSNATGPVVTGAVTDVACFGTCTGSITATASGTAPPFSFQWSNGSSGATVTNLCKGAITVTVTDANGCVTIQSFTVNDNPQLQLNTPQITQPTCNQCNGLASISAFGGSLPYNYVWTTGASGQSVSNLCAGLYQVQITDNLGCQQTANVVINNSNGIDGDNVNKLDETCFASCNGAATVTAVGGTAPISYNWITPAVSTPAASNLCSGTYYVQMTDAVGCIRTTSFQINSVADLTLTPAIVQPACTVANGSINVTVTGGVAPYTFAWLPAGTTSSLTNIGPGSYTLNVTDANGCSKQQVIDISTLNAPTITYTQTNINCFGDCTGAVAIVASGTATPFTYNWTGGVSLPTVSNLCVGAVNLTVTGSDGCVNVHSFTLTDNPKLDLSLPNLKTPNCFNGCDGAITLLPSGGSLPYTYSWMPTGNSNNPQTSLCAGNYTAMITDAKGCVNTASVTLNNPPSMLVTANTNNSSCSTVADGSIGVTVSGGTPAYTYSWTGPANFSSNQPNISNVLAGSYTLNLVDNGGCTRDTVLVLAPTITITAVAGNDTTACSSNPVVLNGSASQGAVKYDWYQLPNTTIPVATTASFTPNAVGNATYVLVTVASVSNCVSRDTVVVNAYPDFIVDAGPNVIIPVFSTVTIGGNPTADGAVSLTWTPAFTLSDPTIPNPVASNTLNTVYTVTAIDANGCIVSDSMKVELYPEVKIPNGFSPNADGKNDSWIIDYIDQFPNNTVEVYNRWGEQLFYSKGYGVPFNGTYHGKDLPVGTYYYIIHLNHPAYTKPYTGPLTIFR